MKENCYGHVENIDAILEHFHSVLGLAGELKRLGYNKNLKSKPGKFYEKFCICLFQIDDIAECLRRLSCGHQFYINCFNKWFADLYINSDLKYPLCKQMETFKHIQGIYCLKDSESIHINNNNS